MAMAMAIAILVEKKMLMDFEQIKSTVAIASTDDDPCVRAQYKNRQVGIFHF